jgi:hypothetical protein
MEKSLHPKVHDVFPCLYLLNFTSDRSLFDHCFSCLLHRRPGVIVCLRGCYCHPSDFLQLLVVQAPQACSFHSLPACPGHPAPIVEFRISHRHSSLCESYHDLGIESAAKESGLKMSNTDLQALFANIRPRSREPSSSGNTNTSAQANNAAIAAASPVPQWPSAVNPAHMPNDESTSGQTKTASSNAATAQSLLKLLNFGAPASSTAQPATTSPFANVAAPKADAQPSVSASDLVARFMSPPTVPAASQPTPPIPSVEDTGGGSYKPTEEQDNPAQDALLKLLNKNRSTSSSQTASAEHAPAVPAESHKDVAPQSTIEQPKPIFTYKNPFEALNSSRKPTPSLSTPQPEPDKSPIFSTAAVDRGASPAEISGRKKLTPRSTSAKIERLARESSVVSETAEPTTKEESPAPAETTLPIRPAQTQTATEPEKNTLAEATPNGREQPGGGSLSIEEKAAIASAEVEWEDSKESPAGGADEWEDAEESPAPDPAPRDVVVYNFPIRPFISLTMHFESLSDVPIREEGVMEISRLKKPFDQLDRSLAAATTKYISYALVKNGGMRIIRQDDGMDRHVFKNSGDRIFNVAFCTTALSAPPTEHQAILGTGISGTVYYATVSNEGNDLFEKNELDTDALAFPPWPQADENSAGGVLKTRAKCSSRHPEYFAIGRGKSIHIIWPATAMFSKYGITDSNRQVDMEKLYQERNLQIATGKAGKDFAFSEDDTMIVSLDKTGRLRFWDIRPLTSEAVATAGKIAPVKIDTPTLSLATASGNDKSWPTSVLLLDKARPYVKSGALRYVLVGLRQNHTLQLWDIALGKAVQELNFPHENENDGVCSVSYHPGSGIIVVGHPTRNSLFFIHLSAPRYTLSSSMTQADYLAAIAAKDPDVPKPDSTACMSGVREISFASKGELRSVELLPLHKSKTASADKSDSDALFELYAVHSKGVTCLSITKADLGWDANSKIVHGVSAVETGVVSTKDLKLGSVIEEPTRTKSPPDEQSSGNGKASKKKAKKAQQAAETLLAPLVDEPPAAPVVAPPEPVEPVPGGQEPVPANGEVQPVKESKKARKRAAAAEAAAAAQVSQQARAASPMKTGAEPEKTASAVTSASTAEASREADTQQVSIGISGDWLDKEMQKLEQVISKDFKKELSTLYSNIQNDRLVQDSTASARQEAVLRLVSQTLTHNVEKSIANIVGAQIQQVVVPSINNVTAQAVQTHVADAVSRTMQHMLPQELGKHILPAVQSVLTGQSFARTIQDGVAQKVSKQLDHHISDSISRSVGPAIVAAAEKAASDVEARMSAYVEKLEEGRRRDMARMEKMNAVIAGMAETLQSMSSTQVSFQEQILRDREQLNQLSGGDGSRQPPAEHVSASPAPIAAPIPVRPKSKQELEQEEIENMMGEGRYEEASIRWLQSQHPVELFDNLFIRFTPEYLSTDVSALVAFTIAVTVSKNMDTNLERRLEWINAAMDAVDFRVSGTVYSIVVLTNDLQDAEIAELSQHAPQLLDTLVAKLEGMYMRLAEEDHNNPVIKQIPPVARKVRGMRTALTA